MKRIAIIVALVVICMGIVKERQERQVRAIREHVSEVSIHNNWITQIKEGRIK